MQILGIDYGQRKLGLAVSFGKLADPMKVLKVRSIDDAVEKASKFVEEKEIEKIVVGVSEGDMADEAMAFGEKLEYMAGKPVVFQDETLTTQDAQGLSIKAGISRKKRKKMEDAYSAALILQAYLDKTEI